MALKKENMKNNLVALNSSRKGVSKLQFFTTSALILLAISTVGFGAYNVVTTESQKTMIASNNTDNNKNIETITTELSTMYDELDTIKEVVYTSQSTLGNTNDSGVTDVVTSLDTINHNIDGAQLDIANLLDYINNGGSITAEDYESIINKYGDIQKNVTAINISLSETIDSLNTNIENLSSSSNKNYEDIITNLSDVSSSLSTANNKFEANVNQQFKSINEAMKKQNNELLSKIESGNSELTEQIKKNDESLNKTISSNNITMMSAMDEYSTNINNNVIANNGLLNSLTSKVGTNQEAVMKYLAEMEERWNSKYTQVFQSVANGKKSLASALATKGKEISDDATFEEIYNAIMGIETSITVENVPGDIKYNRHHHSSEDGTLYPNNAEVLYRTTDPGGCFIADGHTHSATSAQNAYNNNHNNVKYDGHKCTAKYWTTQESDNGCNGTMEFVGRQMMTFNGNGGPFEANAYITQCNKCGGTSVAPFTNDTGMRCGRNKQTVTVHHYEYTCGSPVNTYKLGCGMVENQILSAEIVWTQVDENTPGVNHYDAPLNNQP